MSGSLIIDYEYNAKEIKSFIEEGTFFSLFDKGDANKILKHANLTSDNYISLLKEGKAMYSSSKLFKYICGSHVSFKNVDEMIDVLQFAAKNLNLAILHDVIDAVTSLVTQLNTSKSSISDLQKTIQNLQLEIVDLKKQVQTFNEKINLLSTDNEKLKEYSNQMNCLSRMVEYKNSDDFYQIC